MSQPIPPRPLFVKMMLTADGRRLRALWRLLIHFFFLVVFYMVFSLPLAIAQNFNWLDSTNVFVASTLVISLAITTTTFLATRWLDKRPVSSLGLSWDRRAAADLLFGFLLAGLVMGGIYILFSGLGWLDFEQWIWETLPTSQVIRWVVTMLLVFILVGWYEELLFRGYWLQNLAVGINLPIAIIITSSIFATGHLGNPNVSWAIFPGLIALGLVMAYGYLRSRRLWIPFALHAGWNFFQGTIFGFPVSGVENFSLIQHQVNGSEIITGGSFGPEAGLIILPFIFVAAGIIWLYTQKVYQTVRSIEPKSARLANSFTDPDQK